jgi:hypothetical protein
MAEEASGDADSPLSIGDAATRKERGNGVDLQHSTIGFVREAGPE